MNGRGRRTVGAARSGLTEPGAGGYGKHAGRDDGHPPETRGQRVADPTALTDAERAKLEARRDRLMKLIKDGGSDLEADDRDDLMQEWNKIDQQLNRRER